MNDTELINLYFARSQSAIAETGRKYGSYLHTIAYNILVDVRDTEEVLQDAYLAAWNAIPPERPRVLKHYLSRVTRNLALDRLDYRNAGKRSPNMLTVLEELDACIPDNSLDRAMEQKELTALLNDFLGTLPDKDRRIFVSRYFYTMPIKAIAKQQGMAERTVKYRLHKLREQLKEQLAKEGIPL